jgi:predicted SnoaL-like aldol condensation-catalyzing enzyme
MASDILHARDGTFVEHWEVIQDNALRDSSMSDLPVFGDNFGE